MNTILFITKKNIEQNLKNNHAALITLALSVDESDEAKNIEKLVEKISDSYNNIYALQLAPNGLMKINNPTKTNTTVNLDILHDPIHKDASQKAIKTKSITFSGPFALEKGELAILGRLPIFKEGKFWGFSAVIIKFDTLLKATGISSLKNNDYYLQFSRFDPKTSKNEFLLEDKSNFLSKDHITETIPEGNWKIHIICKKNDHFIYLLPISIIGFLLCVLSAFFVLSFLKRPAKLQRLVNIQTYKLNKSEFLFKSIFENAGLGIIYTNTITGQCVDSNDKICQLLGYSKEELKQINFMKLTHPDDRDQDLVYMTKLRNGEIEQFSLEKRYFHKSGQIIWAAITVSPLWEKNEVPTHHIAIIEDITSRKETEKQLIESKRKIKDLIDSVDGIVWEGNSEEPGITFISRKSESMLGYTPEEWIADEYFWRKIIHPEDREWVIESSILAAKEKSKFDKEYRVIAKNGTTVWVRDLVNIYHTQTNKTRFRGIIIDITKSKQFEIDLNNSLQLVTEQNKRLLNFSHIVSHNLRSHTSNIESLIQLIDMSEDEEEKKEFLGLLKTVSDNLNQTMNNLNEVVSIQTDINPIIENLNLKNYIQKTIEVLGNQITKNDVHIQNNISNNATVAFNPAYLESILLNFLSNAIRYKHPDRRPEIILRFYEENKTKVLEIKDNGIGIDLKKNGKKLFGLYKTFTTNPESRGIGLFISKNQIDTMKGRIEVDSAINNGTTFQIHFNNVTEKDMHH